AYNIKGFIKIIQISVVKFHLKLTLTHLFDDRLGISRQLLQKYRTIFQQVKSLARHSARTKTLSYQLFGIMPQIAKYIEIRFQLLGNTFQYCHGAHQQIIISRKLNGIVSKDIAKTLNAIA